MAYVLFACIWLGKGKEKEGDVRLVVVVECAETHIGLISVLPSPI